MVLFNIYDDWLRSISSYTAFSRCVCGVGRWQGSGSGGAWEGRRRGAARRPAPPLSLRPR
jgi:hypothetical protein